MDSNDVSTITKPTRLTKGPKVIAVIYFCLAFLFFLLTILEFLGGLAVGGVQGGLKLLIALGGIVNLVIFFVLVIVGIGLLKYKQWARIIAIAIPVIAFISLFYLLSRPEASVTGVSTIGVLDIIPAIYLLFSSKVRADFRTTR
jgi:hypothetical protein